MELATFVGVWANIQESVLTIPKVSLGTGIYDLTLQFSHVQLQCGSLLGKDSTTSFSGASWESLPRIPCQGGSSSYRD